MNQPENKCDKCSGTGKLIAHEMEGNFETVCHFCGGIGKFKPENKSTYCRHKWECTKQVTCFGFTNITHYKCLKCKKKKVMYDNPTGEYTEKQFYKMYGSKK